MRMVWNILRLIAVGAAIGLAYWAQLANAVQDRSVADQRLLIAGAILLVSTFLPWGRRGDEEAAVLAREEPIPPTVRPGWVFWAEMGVWIAVIGVAAFLRLWHLTTSPPCMYYDECAVAWGTMEMFQGKPQPFWVHETNTTILLYYLTYGWFWLLGMGIWQMRSLSSTFGILAVLGMLLYGRRTLGPWAGIFAALVLGTMRWHFNLTRIGWSGTIGTLTVLIFTMYFFRRWTDSLKWRWVLLMSLSVTLGMHLYINYRPAVLMILILHGYVLFFRSFRKHIAGVLIFWMLASGMLGYFAYQTYKEPYVFWKRTRELNIFENSPPDQHRRILWQNIQTYYYMFNANGDFNSRHNIPNAPMLPRWTGLAFVLGAFLALSRFWRMQQFTELLWLGAAMGPGIITFEAPNALRVVAVTPLIAIWSARLARYTYRSVAAILPRQVAGPLVAAAALVAVGTGFNQDFDLYFNKQWKTTDNRRDFHCDLVIIGEAYNEAKDWGIGYMYDESSAQVCFLSARTIGLNREEWRLETLPSRLHEDMNAIFFPRADRPDYLAQVDYWFPGEEHELFKDEVINKPEFHRITVNRGRVNQVFGLTCRQMSGPDGTGETLGTFQMNNWDTLVASRHNPPEGTRSLRLTGSFHVPYRGDVFERLHWPMRFQIAGNQPARIIIGTKTVYAAAPGDETVMEPVMLPIGLYDMQIVMPWPTGGGVPQLLWERENPRVPWEPVPIRRLATKPLPRQGLLGHFFTEWEGRLDLGSLRVTPNFNIRFLNPSPFVRHLYKQTVWMGSLRVPKDGRYLFDIEADKDVVLYIDGEPILTANERMRTNHAERELLAGEHPIEIHYTNNEILILRWTLQGDPELGNLVPIAPEYFTPGAFVPQPEWGYSEILKAPKDRRTP